MTEGVSFWGAAKSFVCTKKVLAVPMNLGDYNAYRGWDLPHDENPYSPGYIVKDTTGHITWTPEAQFVASL